MVNKKKSPDNWGRPRKQLIEGVKEVSLTVQLPETLIKALRKEGKKQGKSMKELIGTSLLSTYAELLNIPQGDNSPVMLEKSNENNLNSRLIKILFKMKRIFIMLIVAMLSFSVEAQNLSTKEVSEAYAKAMKSDVTTFLGILVDGTVSSMKQKLIAKGFKQYSDMLSGQFNGQDVYLSFAANKGKVWRVAVINKTPDSEAQIRLQFNALVRQFKNSTKYDNVKEYDPTIDESEDIDYEMSAHNKEYEAHFYQKSRIEGDSIKWKEQLKLSLLKEVPNATVENIEASWKVMFEFGKLIGKISKHVWFKIHRNYYNSYNILIFYDNEYNKPNGEDL